MFGKLTLTLLVTVVLAFACAEVNAKGLPDGPYKNSCKFCEVKGDVLSCRCYTSQSFYTVSSIDISQCKQGSIGSDKGTLVCTQGDQKTDQNQEPVNNEERSPGNNEG